MRMCIAGGFGISGSALERATDKDENLSEPRSKKDK